jgi:DNA-directed RNA polymerase subunit RPC12/RpoP
MRIGEKVIVQTKRAASVLNGLTGTIIEEKIPDSQLAMLSGVSSWVVKFDEPVEIQGSQIATCEFSESDLYAVDGIPRNIHIAYRMCNMNTYKCGRCGIYLAHIADDDDKSYRELQQMTSCPYCEFPLHD